MVLSLPVVAIVRTRYLPYLAYHSFRCFIPPCCCFSLCLSYNRYRPHIVYQCHAPILCFTIAFASILQTYDFPHRNFIWFCPTRIALACESIIPIELHLSPPSCLAAFQVIQLLRSFRASYDLTRRKKSSSASDYHHVAITVACSNARWPSWSNI